MTTTKISFPEELLSRLKTFITERTGLYFKDYDLRGLEDAISRRMTELKTDSGVAYYSRLTASEAREDELRELLNLLTVNHTYFFRNEAQFKALKENILPEIIEKKGTEYRGQGTENGTQHAEKPVIRIWSAGCSTGEEAYTIAMIIKDVIADTENWQIEILATDASNDALEQARKGIYGANAMRLVDADHLGRYFSETRRPGQAARFALNDEIKKMVKFSYFNLMDNEYPGGFDIVFCRNVVIYFELETTMRVMKKIAGSLNDSGYLFIGYSESLQFISDEFKMVSVEDAIFYVKTKDREPIRRFERLKDKPIPTRTLEEVLDEMSKAEIEAEREESSQTTKKSPKLQETLLEATKSLYAKQYDRALSLVEEAKAIDKNAAEVYYLAAEIRANMGKIGEAREDLKTTLDKNMMFAPAHYLLGSLSLVEGDGGGAEKNFRKAIYLDEGFSLAHFSLANVYRDNGKHKEAIREYRNTLNILSKSQIYDIIAYSGGFNAATLASVCKSNIERLKTAE